MPSYPDPRKPKDDKSKTQYSVMQSKLDKPKSEKVDYSKMPSKLDKPKSEKPKILRPEDDINFLPTELSESSMPSPSKPSKPPVPSRIPLGMSKHAIDAAPPNVKSILVSTKDQEMATRQLDIDNLPAPERRKQEQWAKTQLKRNAGNCAAGFDWYRVEGGYRCYGGNHAVSDELIAEGKAGFYYSIGRMKDEASKDGPLVEPKGSGDKVIGGLGWIGPCYGLEECAKDQEARKRRILGKDRVDFSSMQSGLDRSRSSKAPPDVKSTFTSPQDEKMAARQTKIETLPPNERREQEKWAAQQLTMNSGQCEMGHTWIRRPGGYQCAGQGHFVSDELLAEGKGGHYGRMSNDRDTKDLGSYISTGRFIGILWAGPIYGNVKDMLPAGMEVGYGGAGYSGGGFSRMQSGLDKSKFQAPPRAKSTFISRQDELMAARQTQIESLASQQRREQEEWAQRQLTQNAGSCVEGFDWTRVRGGYRCHGGSHAVTDELLAEGEGGYYLAAGSDRYQAEIERHFGHAFVLGYSWAGPIYGELDPQVPRHLELLLFRIEDGEERMGIFNCGPRNPLPLG